MKPEMRQKLARESYEEKIRKVAQLICLAKTFPRRQRALLREGLADEDAVEQRMDQKSRESAETGAEIYSKA